MLEISVLVLLGKYLYKTAEQKGYPGALFVVILVLSWFGCGIGGGIVGLLENGDMDADFPVGFLLGYLLGVVVAAVGNHILVSLLPDNRESSRPNPAYEARVRQAWEEQEWIDRRRKGVGDLALDGTDGELVPLAPARPPATTAKRADTGTPPPRAKRAWKRKWTS